MPRGPTPVVSLMRRRQDGADRNMPIPSRLRPRRVRKRGKRNGNGGAGTRPNRPTPASGARDPSPHEQRVRRSCGFAVDRPDGPDHSRAPNGPDHSRTPDSARTDPTSGPAVQNAGARQRERRRSRGVPCDPNAALGRDAMGNLATPRNARHATRADNPGPLVRPARDAAAGRSRRRVNPPSLRPANDLAINRQAPRLSGQRPRTEFAELSVVGDLGERAAAVAVNPAPTAVIVPDRAPPRDAAPAVKPDPGRRDPNR